MYSNDSELHGVDYLGFVNKSSGSNLYTGAFFLEKSITVYIICVSTVENTEMSELP